MGDTLPFVQRFMSPPLETRFDEEMDTLSEQEAKLIDQGPVNFPSEIFGQLVPHINFHGPAENQNQTLELVQGLQ